MADDREILETVVQRLARALERGTGTSLDAEEVRVVGALIHAMGTAALGGAEAREACAICGNPEHPPQVIGGFPRHAYQRGLLVPVAAPENR
ncbi:MAG: hypothetical protein KatS3mg011_0799 [Acidimicrobiia bacterium]|nr:MAG: hypothetical protein KatS3mg011_0799 [Acidimicrobiia bacterium]